MFKAAILDRPVASVRSSEAGRGRARVHTVMARTYYVAADYLTALCTLFQYA